MRTKSLVLTFLAVFTFQLGFGVGEAEGQRRQPPKLTKEERRRKENADKLVKEGDTLYRQKNYPAAIQKYDAALALVPQYAYAHFSKGYSYYFLNDFDRALESLGLAETQGHPPIDIYRVRWYVHYAKKDFTQAMADVEAALKIQPSNPTFLLAKGDIYREQNDDKDALTAYTNASLADPNNADVHYFIALTNAKLGDHVQQGSSSARALEKGTKYAGESWLLAGDSLQKSKKYEAAVDAFERALIAKPGYLQAYVSLADVYRLMGRFSDAIATTKTAIKQYPNDGGLYTSLSWYHSLSDNHNDAISSAQQAIRLAPDQYMGFTNLCRAYNDTRQYTQAIAACNSALRLNPGDGETNFYLARAYDFLKRPSEATPYYNKAVTGLLAFAKENPESSDGYYLLGNSYYAVGNRTGAIAAYKKCLDLSPKFTKARFNLGVAYIANGDKASAREQYNELLKLDAQLAEKLLESLK